MPGKETDICSSTAAMRNMVRTIPTTITNQYANHRSGTHVRMGPNLLSINTNTALKTIYGHKSNVRKADFYSAFPANKHTFNVHSSIDKTAHARKRRVLSHAFSDSAIKAMEKYVIDKVQTFCRVLPQAPFDLLSARHSSSTGGEIMEWSVTKNMADMCDYLAFDIMGELAFGKSFDMLESPRNRFASTLVGNAAHRHLIVSRIGRLVTAIAMSSLMNDSAAPTSQSTTTTSTKSSFAK